MTNATTTIGTQPSRFRFRAWHDGRMRSVESLFFSEDGRLSEIGFDKSVGGEPHNTVLMQCTGQPDKTGREICEGDLLSSYGSIFLVRWSDDMGCFQLIGRIKGKDREDSYILHQVPDKQIVGNAFENPDLLPSKE